MANLLIWWRQRTPSEQRLLLGLAGLLVVCALWYGLWQPWRAREAQWRQTLMKEQASLRWMTQQSPRLQQLSQQPTHRRGVNAVSLSVTGQPSRPGWVMVNHLLLERDDES